MSQSPMPPSIGPLFIFVSSFSSGKHLFARKVNVKRGRAGILHLPAGNPCLFEESLCYFTQRGWELAPFEKLWQCTRECFSSDPVFFFCLETSVLIASGGVGVGGVQRVEATSARVLLPRTTSYRMAARASGVSAKPWLARPLRVCASGALTHSPVFSVVAPGPALACATSAPPPGLISSLRSHGDLAGFLCGDGRALFCSSHGHPQEAL